MTLEVLASTQIVIEVVNSVKSNGDIFSPIPIGDLGTDYFAGAYSKRIGITASFITVSAAYNDTQVTMTFPPQLRESSSTSQRVVLGDVTYFSNDVITFNLSRLQTLQLQSSMDLTGTHIVSSRPVAVLSGQNRSNVDGPGCLSHLLEQMPPTDHWASLFILIHLPGQQAGDNYRFIAKKPHTTITLGGGSNVLKIQNVGEFVEYELPDGEFVYAEADKPVLVLHYTREQPKTSGHHGDPALMALTSLEHTNDVYHIITDVISKTAYLVITVTMQDKPSLKMNGVNLSTRNVTWHDVSGSMNYVVGHLELESGDMPCTLGEVGGVHFNAHVFYVSYCECWAMSLTHGTPMVQSGNSNCPTSSHSPGDGIDNDCDSSIDEEPCYVNSEPLDEDGDQLKNEDCAGGNALKCIDPTGNPYTCEETKASSVFTEEPGSRRFADMMTPVVEANSKITCGLKCIRTPGCWGTNFDPSGRGGHRCELLFGWGRGLFAAEGWGFQSMSLAKTYSAP